MPDLISREIQLVSRPQGMPTAANFALVETKLELRKDEWVLVRNLYLSVDPYMRGRMNDRQSYVPPFELGKAMDGGAVGEVIESHAEKFKPGVGVGVGTASRNENLVTSNFGWREYSGYNAAMPQHGPSNLFNITAKRLTMKGLIASDWLGHQAEFEREVGGYFRAGKLKNKQTVVVGIDKAVSAFFGLFDGKNIGKMVVKLE